MLAFPFQMQAQDNALLDQFSVYEINNKPYLYWVISTGSSCNGIGILRSDDSLHFHEIFDIAGICGNVSAPTAYDYTDVSPLLNRKTWYKLRLGNGGYSQTLSITIYATSVNGYSVIPNPVSDIASVYFENPEKEEVEIRIYSVSGKIISTLYTRNNFINADVKNLQGGLYLFSVYGEGIDTRGKFLVVK